MKTWIVGMVMVLAMTLTAGAAKPVNTTLIGNKAIKGYDPVAYFTHGRPVKGDKQYTHDWNGATWYFATDEHRMRFKQEPDRYAPQYGGYCAWAVSQGDTADIDPEAWKIVDGKLYLNYSLKIQKKWEADIPGLVRKANENWPKLLAK
jgi:YHS domain-containing protein